MTVLRVPALELGQQLTWADPLLRIVRETATAISYLHSLGCIVRDVKCRDVLLTEAFEARLSDLGEAVFKSEAIELVGTPRLVAHHIYVCAAVLAHSFGSSTGVPCVR